MSLVLIVSTSSVLAQVIVIKLNCQISLTRNFSAGSSEKEQLTEIFEIHQLDGFLAIIGTSGDFGAVSTLAIDRGFVVFDYSNENKWDLTNEKEGNRRQIMIDRNTGQIYYSFNFKGTRGPAQWQGNGSCRKVDIDKKLF
jgi:hypothetical protein